MDNLAPVDKDSLRDAINHIQFQRKITVPDFDLCIRYYDVNDDDHVSRDLVRIRYRKSQIDDGHGANVQPTEPRWIGSLDCDDNRGLMIELHRHSWICAGGLPFRWLAYLPHADRQEYLQRKQEEYARTFPQDGVGSSDTLHR